MSITSLALRAMPNTNLYRFAQAPPKLSLLVCLVLLLALNNTAAAQADTTQTILPDIAPREVEIKGQLEIAFPSLQRQPLVGFNPPPRIPRLPLDRRPYAESFRDASASPDVSSLQKPVPPAGLLNPLPPSQGRIETTLGRYFSRSVYARTSATVGNNTSFLTRLDYRGAQGHKPFAGQPDVNTPYDAVAGEVGILSARSNVSLGLSLEGFFDSYQLFGAELMSQRPTAPNLVKPDREGLGGQGVFSLRTSSGMPFNVELDVRYGGAEYETKFTQGTNIIVDNIGESRLESRATFFVPVGSGSLTMDGFYSGGRLVNDGGHSRGLEGAASYTFKSSGLAISAGLRFLGAFSAVPTSDSLSNIERRLGYASPDLRIDYSLSPTVSIYAKNSPGIDANTLAQVFRENPYLTPIPHLRPSLRTVDAEGGLRLFGGPVQFSLKGGYQRFPQRLFFERYASSTPAEEVRGFSSLQYGKTQIIHAGGTISTVLPQGIQAFAALTYRKGRLLDESVDLPYFAPWVGRVSVSYAFLQNRGLVQLAGNYESSRFVDRANADKAESYVDLDFEASYNVTSLVGIIMRLENISGQNNARWENYPQPPMMLGFGVRFLW